MSAIVSLGSVATFRKGSGLPKSALRPDGRFRCIHYGELFTKYGPVIVSPKSRTSADLPIRSTTGDVLMPTSDVTPRGLAKASAILQDGVVLGGDILVIRSNPARVDPRYLAYVIRNDANQVLKLVRGSTVYHLYATDMRQFQLSLPAIEQQKRAADALQDVDDLIATLERLIAKKQAIKQGMMQQLLTGRTRLPGFASVWKEVALGSVASITMGQSPAGATYNSDARGLPLIQGNADIRGRTTFDRIWTSAPTKVCEAGDVLLTVRAPVGYTAVASKRSCLGRGVCAISASHDNRFMFHALVYAEPAWALYEQGSTFTAVNSNEVRSFAIQWATDPEERRAIAQVLDDADNELASLQARLAKALAIKTGMMQQLLTGRVRLPVEAAS